MASVLVLVFVWSIVRLADGWDCPSKEWAGFGELDPHLIVQFHDKTFDRPVCFDMSGKPNEKYSLFYRPEFEFTATLIKAPNRHFHPRRLLGERPTYFGKFTFSLLNKNLVIDIAPGFVTIKNATGTSSVTWNKIHNHVGYNDTKNDVYLSQHWDNVLHLNCSGNQFYIKRNNKRYKLNRHTPARRVHFLGVYLQPKPALTFKGIIGQFLNKQAVFRRTKARNMIFYRGRTIDVVDHNVVDLLNHRHINCWHIPYPEKYFLSHKFKYYLRP